MPRRDQGEKSAQRASLYNGPKRTRGEKCSESQQSRQPTLLITQKPSDDPLSTRPLKLDRGLKISACIRIINKLNLPTSRKVMALEFVTGYAAAVVILRLRHADVKVRLSLMRG